MQMGLRAPGFFWKTWVSAGLIALLGVAVDSHAAARWEAIGPEGGSVVALASDAGDSQTFYAGLSEGGVWRSADGGASWSAAQGGLPPGTIRALVADPATPGTLYLGRGGDGVWKSADGGRSWSPAAAILGGVAPDVRVLRFDPSSRTLWAGLVPKVGQASIYRTGDGGQTWESVDLATAGLTVTALTFASGDVFVGVAEPAIQHGFAGVYRGSIAGGSWSQVLASPVVNFLAWGGGRLYATTASGLSVSRDRGATWTALATLPPNVPPLAPSQVTLGEVALSPHDPDLLYVAFHVVPGVSPLQDGLLRSRDGGVTQEAVAGGFPPFQAQALTFDPASPGRLLAGPGPLGIWSSPDGASGWRSGNRELKAAPVSKVLADPKRPGILYAGGTGQGLVRTLDGGATWVPVNGGGRIDEPQALDPEQPATIYAFGDGPSERGLFKSRNGGRSWALLPAPALSFALDPVHPKTLFAGGTGGSSNPIFRSDDGGATWTRGSVSCTFPYHLAVAPTGEVYTGGSSFCGLLGADFGGADRSDDRGKTFINRRIGLPGMPVPSSLAVDPRRPATLYGGFHGYLAQNEGLEFGDWVFRSRDRADHWERVEGLAALKAPALDFAFPPVGPNALWVASGGQGIWRSGDVGETFRPVTTPGLTTATVFDLEFDRRVPATLYAATPGGLFRLVSE